MKSLNQLCPNLRTLLLSCEPVSQVYQAPFEAVIVHALTMVSGLAGDFVSSVPTGSVPVKADFSLLFAIPDKSASPWMEREHEALLQRWRVRQGAAIPTFVPRNKKRDLQRHLLAVEALGGKDDIEAHILRATMERLKHEKRFRLIMAAGDSNSASAAKKAKTARGQSVLVSGERDLLRLIGGKGRDTALGAMIAKPEDASGNLFGWADSSTLGKLSKRSGLDGLRHFGWIVERSGGFTPSPQTVEPALVTGWISGRLECLRFSKSPLEFKPFTEDVLFLNQQVANLDLRLEMLPEVQRAVAVPDRFLAWHLSALLAALCGTDQKITGPGTTSQYTSVGLTLAEYVIQNHLHRFRRSFPADRNQPLAGIDLRMFRLLPDQPCPVRDMQRRFRGLNKAACLATLSKLVDLGLAHECDGGRFQKAPPPVPRLRLSDFMSDFGLRPGNPSSPGRKSTDSTDKTNLSLSGPDSHGGNSGS